MNNYNFHLSCQLNNISIICINLYNSYIGTKNLCLELNNHFKLYICFLNEFNATALFQSKPMEYLYYTKGKSALIVPKIFGPHSFIINNNIDFIGVITKVQAKIYYFGCIYLSPSLTITETKNIMHRIYQYFQPRKTEHLIIAGDFNAEHPTWSLCDTNIHRKIAKGRIIHQSLSQLNLIPVAAPTEFNYTRWDDTNKKSWIDIIFVTEKIKNEFSNYSTSDYFSDHQLLKVCFNPSNIIQITRQITAKKLDTHLFIELLKSLQEPHLDDNPSTVNDNISDFILGISSCVKQSIKNVKINSDTRINSFVRKCKKTINRLNRHKKICKNMDGKIFIKNCIRSTMKDMRMRLNQLRAKNIHSITTKYKKDPWTAINKILNLDVNLTSNTDSPDNIHTLKEESLNSIIKEFTLSDTTYNDNEYLINNNHEIDQTIFDQTFKSISNTKTKDIFGLDKNSYFVVLTVFKRTFIKIFQTCLNTCLFPDIFKKSYVCLIPKKGSHKLRRICIQSVMGKHLEYIIYHFINSSLIIDDRNWFTNQFGFVKHRNIDLVLCNLIHNIRNAISNEKQKCLLLSIDVEGAFDNIEHTALISSLQSTSLQHSITSMVANYLRNRFLHLNHMENQLIMKQSKGVPQGSVLGPLLWNISIDRICDLELEASRIFIYADDIFLLYVLNLRQQPSYVIERDLKKILTYLSAYGLTCNLAKSNIISFGTNTNMKTIKTSIGYIQFVKKLDILGFTLHKKLKAKYHISKLEQNMDSILHILSLQRNCFRFLPISFKKILLYSLFKSRIFCHAGSLFLICQTKDYARIDRMMSHAIKLIFCLIKSTSTNGAFTISRSFDMKHDVLNLVQKWKLSNDEYDKVLRNDVCNPDSCTSYNNVIDLLFDRKQLYRAKIEDTIYTYTMLFLSNSFIHILNIDRNVEESRCPCNAEKFSVEHMIFHCNLTKSYLWQNITGNEKIPGTEVVPFLARLTILINALNPKQKYEPEKYLRKLINLNFQAM